MLYVSSPFEAKVYRYFVPEDYSPDQQFTSFDVLLSTLVYLKYPPGNQGNSHDNCNQGHYLVDLISISRMFASSVFAFPVVSE